MFRPLALLLLGLALAGCSGGAERITPQAAAERLAAGDAVLLAMSDFNGPQTAWKPFLAQHRDRTLLLICRTGRRSGLIADQLAAQGYRTLNVGGFSDWAAAGLPIRPVPDAR